MEAARNDCFRNHFTPGGSTMNAPKTLAAALLSAVLAAGCTGVGPVAPVDSALQSQDSDVDRLPPVEYPPPNPLPPVDRLPPVEYPPPMPEPPVEDPPIEDPPVWPEPPVKADDADSA
jgi:hypothetical protein